jgi:ABC-2 type transport system permease protein
MRNFWLVAKHAYRHMVVRRGFIILTAAIPLGLALLITIAILIEVSGENNLPIGYVDKLGFLNESLQTSLPDPEDRVEVRAFSDEETALEALEQEKIQAFFVFPPEYEATLKTELYFLEEQPRNEVWREFDDFVRINMVDGLPGDVQERLLEGPSITVHDIVSDRDFSENQIINIVIPVVASIVFFFATMSAAGYLLGVVASEKENRTMELMLTSVTPSQLILGKAIGLLAAALTQLAIYIIAAVVGLSIASRYVEVLQFITVPWQYLGVVALFFFPAYALVAAVMVAIGGAVTEMQQAQQVAGIINLFFMVPFFLMGVLITNPGHPLMTFFTIFPTTSFLTVSMRWGLGTIPVWQIGVSWVVLTGTMFFMLWAAAKIFRAGMLRYGQALSLKAAAAAVRGK